MTVQLFVYPTRSMARRINPSLQILKELQVSEQIPNYMAYLYPISCETKGWNTYRSRFKK